MIICVIEVKGKERTEGILIRNVYRFDLEDGKKFCYRSRVSHNAFFHSLKQRNWYPKADMRDFKFLWTSKHEDEAKMELEIWNSQKEILAFNYIDCTNIWDFYKKIGWDYKSKKWSRND